MFRDCCGSQQQFFQRKLSAAAQRVIISRQGARNTGGQWTSQTQFRICLPVPHKHVACCRRGCGLPAIDGDKPAVGQPDQNETASADAGVRSVHNAEGQSGGHRGIYGVSSLLERLHRCIGRQRMDGRDDAAPAARQFPARLKQGSAKQSDSQACDHMTRKGGFHSHSCVRLTDSLEPEKIPAGLTGGDWKSESRFIASPKTSLPFPVV